MDGVSVRAFAIADTLLDRSLIGYGNVGFLVRRRWWPPDAAPGALDGKTALVTGAKTGLGKATAIGLARLGAHVRLVVRGHTEGEAAAAEIRRAAPGSRITVDECDVALMADVRRYAAGIDAPVHVLVHNAGVMPRQRQETPEGHESMLATHVLGPHLLTTLLQPALTTEGPATVVFVSSGGMYGQRLSLDDLQYRRQPYRPTVGYARTKRMQVILADTWSGHLQGTRAAVYSAHPGWADTPGVARWLPRFRSLTRPLLRTPEQGADTVVWLAATRPEHGRGRFWHDRAPRPAHYTRRTRENADERAALWNACQRLTGLDTAR